MLELAGFLLSEVPVVQRRPVRLEPAARRIRVLFGGRVIADSTDPLLVWELPYYPTYYLPVADVDPGCLIPTERILRSPVRGPGRVFSVKAGGREAAGAALAYPDSPVEQLRDRVRFDWSSMDAWFEEDEEVYTHPRDPYVRVDILASSRTARVELGGVVVAESPRPRLLFETGLATRCYLPRTDVRPGLLEPSDTVTRCPYKGTARYWSVRVGHELFRDVAWSYPSPLPESQKIAGLIAFLDEKVTLHLDGAHS